MNFHGCNMSRKSGLKRIAKRCFLSLVNCEYILTNVRDKFAIYCADDFTRKDKNSNVIFKNKNSFFTYFHDNENHQNLDKLTVQK